MFDAIMGVGKTPEITKSFTSNPYQTIGEEVTNVSVITTQLSGNHSITEGSIINITNPFFDYVANNALVISRTTMGSGTSYLTIDLGRELVLRAIEMYFENGGYTTETITVACQTSKDGTIYEEDSDIASDSDTGGTEYTKVWKDKVCRYIRIRLTSAGGAATPAVILTVNRLRIFLNPIQYLY